MINKNNQEAGYTLISVILIFTLLTVLGLSLVTLSLTSVKTSNIEHNDQAAFYIAEAGLNYKLNELKGKIQEIYKLEEVKNEEDFNEKLVDIEVDSDEFTDFELVNGVQPRAEITVNILEETDNEFIVTSKGIIDNQSRTVASTIEVQWEDKYEEREIDPEPFESPPFVAFGKSNITINGKVDGDIATTSELAGSIKIQGDGYEGDIYVPNGNMDIVEGVGDVNVYSLDGSWGFPELPPFNVPLTVKTITGSISDVYIYQPTYIEEITSSITIDVADGHQTLVTKNLSGQGNFELNLTGDGVLSLYILESFDISGNAKFNEKEKLDRLFIFYEGGDLDFTGTMNVYASIYAKTANIDLGGNFNIHGNIFTGGNEVTLFGNTEVKSQLILAPNAKVTTKGGASFSGSILANEINIGGEAVYDVPFISMGPISPVGVGLGSGESGSGGGTELIETGASPSFTTTPMKEID